MDTVVIHYSEIMLKGKNRPRFLRVLLSNIENVIEEALVKSAVGMKFPGRVVLSRVPSAGLPLLRDRFMRVPGIANFLIGSQTLPTLKALKERLARELAKHPFKTFRVTSQRADKSLPFTSQDVNEKLGEWVRKLTGATVDLMNPELTIYVEALEGEFFFGFEKYKGLGGLPVGSSGRVVSLFSGGIDSAVASFMMMKRGCRVIFVHFHSYPYLSKTSQEKAAALVKLLDDYQLHSRLYLIPFGDLQKELLLHSPARYLVLLYRRFMFRIAERIAAQEKAAALVTGESVGQVASQTLENIGVIGSVASLPILRPLAGMNKDEIITQARALGTYDVSIIPDQDCCQLFVPKHPATKAKRNLIETLESRLDTQKLVEKMLGEVEVKEF